ncbi:hypothetical protein GPX89_20405 [Nocardia sp. ET3-3]|uniref:DUF1540 domain-containing protein n=1 Tax=Nocardia terrae TaxID=2675851 RepID=A0A7K1UZA1_9NOCA|nr:hypothetical protein [Nocardia terrae]
MCESALDHCHGTLIVHAAGSVECTESDCFDTGRARHLFVADCADVAGGCSCVGAAMETGRHTRAG